MSTSADFPGNCTTNIHILHDFAEIAYIVCTHANPASSENVADATSPAKILDRLRNAEKQFRQHSILVALDAEKLELFTFYRKVDVVKDQRTILNKFGYVCRLNSCIIANKSAARILDLLKPESSRIYRLFTSAILSSIQILSKDNEAAVRVGTKIYLAPAPEAPDTDIGRPPGFCAEWHIHRMTVQALASGQLVLTLRNAKSARLYRVSDLVQEQSVTNPPAESLVYILATGQIARYTTSFTGTREELSDSVPAATAVSHDPIKFMLAQISAVSDWLKARHSDLAVGLDETSRWIQIEIAVLEAKGDQLVTAERLLTWKSLMWPSQLTYVFKKSTVRLDSSKKNPTDEDPLKFVLDWYNSSAERTGQLARAQASKDLKEDIDEDTVFADDGHYEDHFNPQVFGPPTFPPSQMVYPTPPEVTMTHQTPGMSSVDGLAQTPAPIFNASQVDSEPFLDQEMSDSHDQQPNRVGTGFYDEDLFEEMPDDKFTSNPDGEPNWDFFDQPGFESSIDAAEKAGRPFQSPELHESDVNATVNEHAMKDEDFLDLEDPKQSRAGDDIVHDVDLAVSSPLKLDSVYDDDLSLSPTKIRHIEHIGRTPEQSVDDTASTRPNTSLDIEPDGQPSDVHRERRRSSIFEGIAANAVSQDRDVRYSKHGKFWFDNEPAMQMKGAPLSHNSDRKRSHSSASDKSMSSEASNSASSSLVIAAETYIGKRAWTEYHPEGPAEIHSQIDHMNQDQSEIDTQSLLAVIGAATGEDPFLVQIEPPANTHRRPNYGMQKMLMIAQILVDQVSQSSLLRAEHNVQLQKVDNYSLVDVIMDHSGTRTPINHATLAELTALPPRNNPRIARLNDRLVCVNRSDGQIVARQTILPFWDMLGLQPYSKPKDVTALCMYPSGSNVAEGCVVFLNRLSDTYTTCNLGLHPIGRYAGLTNDGMLAWTPQSTSGPHLKQLCQRLGAAIGGSNSSADTTIVIYMVSPTKDAACYREMCHAFKVLFEAFVDTSEGTKKNVELVLQIVPLDFIASSDTVVVPTQDAYLDLALEVYNRVPMRQVTMMAASCGSAVVLEKHQPQSPLFELSNTVLSPMSKDGPCLHLAYSYSLDKRWLVAAWSDERGIVAFTMSYCLNVTNGAKTHPKREVFRNMWEISYDIMSRWRIKWRLVVAHPGLYEMEDVGEWQQLINQAGEDRRMVSRIILISVDLNPDVVLEMVAAPIKTAQPPTISQIPNASGTPVTTPQTSITSPDQVIAATPTPGNMTQTNAATPPEQNPEYGHDMDTMIIDPTDQSWAISLGYGINQSLSFLDLRPAAASGLLAKRISSKDEAQSLRLLGINLVAVPRLQPTSLSLSEREAILQEVMEQYKGLVTLAVSRACIDKSTECVPWHVAVAIKGSRTLNEAM